MLVGTTDRGLYVVGPDGQIENFRLSDGLPSNEITSIAVETDGERRAFIATSAGISQYVALRGQLQRAVCGDGIVDVSEECDDGGVRTGTMLFGLSSCTVWGSMTRMPVANAVFCPLIPAMASTAIATVRSMRTVQRPVRTLSPFVSSASCIDGACGISVCSPGRFDADGHLKTGANASGRLVLKKRAMVSMMIVMAKSMKVVRPLNLVVSQP